MKMKFQILVATLCLTTLTAMAGNESHGGDIVVCQGAAPVVLDYYNAALKGIGEVAANIIDTTSFSREQVVQYFTTKLQPYLVNTEFQNALTALGDFDHWTEADLKTVDDADAPYFLPASCSRQQGAVRQGNEMFVDPTYVGPLSESQRGMLIVHEALYYVAALHGQKDSVTVRELVRAVLRKDTTEPQLIQAIHDLGSYAYGFETIAPSAGGDYGSYTTNCPDQWAFHFERASAIPRTLYARADEVGATEDPTVFHCDEDGVTCVVTTPAKVGTSSVLSQMGAKMVIGDYGRRLDFGPSAIGGGECLFYRPTFSPGWPMPVTGNGA